MTGEPSDVQTEEREHLAATLDRLEAKIAALTETLGSHDTDYRGLKAYMAENRGELDPAEMYQNELILNGIDARGAHAMRARERLETMRGSPYFARLDFTPDTAAGAEAHYIGRQGLQDAEGTAVVDWRTPLGGMFYESEPGPAAYEAPSGEIGGRIERKRQIKVEGGKLRFAVDTAEAIRDEILLEEIGRTSDAHMRSIISTIQRDQNAIIRNESDSTLLIQGVAGSGKTSIALHRIAYLLFRLRGRLQAHNIAIVSPNGLFAEYVSEVLPELGEEPVVSLDLESIARTRLAEHRMDFTAPVDPVEPGDGAEHERARAKATLAFHQWLERAVTEAVEDSFVARDLRVRTFRVDAEDLRTRFAALSHVPLRARLRSMAEHLCAAARLEDPSAAFPPKPGEVNKELTAMLKVKTARALYRDLYRRPDAPAAFRAPSAKTLEWGDVYPFLFVAARFHGSTPDQEIQHLVIDEMQDHSPTQYAVLQQLYRCNMTVLGDVAQALGNTEDYTPGSLGGLFRDARVMELTRSYRSTAEIMRFACGIRGDEVTTIDRHGDEPEVLGFGTGASEAGWLAEEIARFRAAGGGRLAIITRSHAQARALHGELAEKVEGLTLASADSRGILGHDVTVLPVGLAKGLEFDEVVVARASAEEYAADADRSLLYIACTRALHRLTVTHPGRPSPHLPV
ncbi:AAA family ATPase [Nocardiopsis sp. HNM0947]|uniref:AAA family ATPase n=1 Tax=Nocardiopsis coralli TaxID=2772213 RepID=A0ABR9P3D8_9ACTN|nr:AAA family ATPase [Nocardiopsis coralli]MBE2998333.1 AAA family ATPase [Nocardiopsis coralli]